MKTLIYTLVLFALLAGLLFFPVSAVSAAASCGDTYTVQKGDYLTKIAKNCDVTYDSLLKANPEIKDPDLIYVGQVIRIKAGATLPGIPVTGTQEYVVVKGDTLFKIAVRFDTTVAELLKLNPEIKDASKIYVGQKIRVGSAPTTSGPVTLSATSAKAGDVIEVKVKGFPTSADIDVRLGKDGQSASVIVDGTTDASGNATVKITIPSAAKVGEK